MEILLALAFSSMYFVAIQSRSGNMGALLGISLWVALATVVPGCITIACIWGAFAIINPTLLNQGALSACLANDWICASIAITIMVLTQAVGILIEKRFVDNEWYGKADTAEESEAEKRADPYVEYSGLYVVLAGLREEDDSKGHLERVLAQFFLNNNVIVSFAAGMLVSAVITLLYLDHDILIRGLSYFLFMGICLVICIKVAKIRFNVMIKSLSAVRQAKRDDLTTERVE